LHHRMYLLLIPLFILPSVLLGPFAVLSGLLDTQRLIQILVSPVATAAIVFNLVLSYVLIGLLWKRQFQGALESGDRPAAARRAVHTAVAVYWAFVLWEGCIAWVLTQVIVKLDLPNSPVWLAVLIFAFLLFVAAPLFLRYLGALEEECTDRGVAVESPVLALQFRLMAVIFPLFLGALFLMMSVNQTHVLRSQTSTPPPLDLATTNLIIGFTTFLVTVILVRSLSVLILRPVNQLKGLLAKGMAGDMTVRGTARSQNEIGQMSRTGTVFFEWLDKGFGSLKGESLVLARNKTELDKSVEQVTGSVNTIVHGVDRSKALVEDQSSFVNETAAAVEQLARNIESLDKALQDQKTHIQATSNSISAFKDNADEIRSTMVGVQRESAGLQSQNASTLAVVEKMTVNIQAVVGSRRP